MEHSIIRDINIAATGHAKIDWVAGRMPVINMLWDEMVPNRVLAGDRLVLTLHIEAKTAHTVLLLKAAGAEVVLTGSNPLSTQDDVAAALVERGIRVY
ncbi:MAG: adenosylhomocysteinase, partial [Negativicutes bacterium]|nr:adenosylhomocysteinase [Negativicutes bacterium]